MTETYGEPVTAGFDHVFRGRLVHRERSDFQLVEVYEHEHFGKMLMLDEVVQTTERDEFCYHEMLVHPALCSREPIERVLVIGGGDGGTLRHVLMHDPAEAVMCEIDEAVVRVSREHLPALSGEAFDDPRTTLLYDDGAAYVARHEGAFDAIIVDSTDPVGPAVILFSEGFYAACRTALKSDGILVAQSGSPFYQEREFKLAVGNMSKAFPTVEVYHGFVPTYPGVFWAYTVGTVGAPPSTMSPADVERRLTGRGITTRAYAPGVHASAFALPPFVAALVEAARAGSGAPSVSRG